MRKQTWKFQQCGKRGPGAVSAISKQKLCSTCWLKSLKEATRQKVKTRIF